MSADQQNLLSMATVRERDLGCCRGSNGCRDSRYDFAFNPCLLECLQFFATAPKDQRIAALQPDDKFPDRGKFNQQAVDLILRDVLAPTSLAHVNDLGRRRGHCQNRRRHQRIVQNHVRSLNQSCGFYREKFRISGTGPDQVHFPFHACLGRYPGLRCRQKACRILIKSSLNTLLCFQKTSVVIAYGKLYD
jgi:hypothetical protein